MDIRGVMQAVDFRATLEAKQLAGPCCRRRRENQAFSRSNLCLLPGFPFPTPGFSCDPWISKSVSAQLGAPMPPFAHRLCPLTGQRQPRRRWGGWEVAQGSGTACCIATHSFKLQGGLSKCSTEPLPPPGHKASGGKDRLRRLYSYLEHSRYCVITMCFSPIRILEKQNL